MTARRLPIVHRCVTILIGVFAALALPAIARAETITLTPEARTFVADDTVQGVLRHYTALPVQGGDGATIADWYSDVENAMGRQSSGAAQVEQDIVKLGQKTGGIPKLRVLGSFGLAVTSFQVGWKIGSGINAKWLHFNTPTQKAHWRYSNYSAHWNPPSDNCGYSANPNPAIPVALCQSGFWQFFSGPYGDKMLADLADDWPTNGVAPWHNYCENPQYGGLPFECEPVISPRGTAFWVRGAASAAEMDAVVSPSRPVPYTNQVVDRDTGASGISDPGVSGMTSTIGSELNDHPEAYPGLIPWINHEADPTNPDHPDPTVPTVKVPTCSSIDTYLTCSAKLDSVGLSANRVVLDLDHAVVTQDPDTVVSTDPAAGADVPEATDVTVTTNPPAEDMPVIVPAPLTHEDGASFESRLSSLHLVPQETVSTTVPSGAWAGDALDTTPGSGTRVHRDTTITVRVAWRPGALYTADEDQDRSCEPTPTSYEEPDPAGPFTPGDPASFLSIDGSVPFWKGDLTWGERHIAAGHGWGTQDRADTLAALEAPDFIVDDRPDDNALDPHLYVKEMPTRNGQPCARVVRVERDRWPDEPDVRGVITSFGTIRTY
jgi:hypothetical protein